MIIKNDPKKQLIRQVDSMYGVSQKEISIVEDVYEIVIKKLDTCFKYVKNKYYQENGKTKFDPLHVGQWTMFLYYMAREATLTSSELSDKLYGLGKCFSSADIYYGVDMPEVWFFDHPQGSVMGRAKYSDFFTFSQGCTVGNNKGKFPVFGEHVTMLSNSKVLGNCVIGDHVIFSANSYVIDSDIPAYSIVFGVSPNITIKSITKGKFNELTGSMFDGEVTRI
jgi:serine O-acetyltransferase